MKYRYNQFEPELLESIVCFTDILGFSNLILETKSNVEEGNNLLRKLRKVLKKQYAEILEYNKYAHFKSFTDNIILAYPKWDDGEGQSGLVFETLMKYQLEMTIEGYFLRGGIAIGDYFGDEDFAYGTALIEAHNLECSDAKHPRIILSEKLIETVSSFLKYYGDAESSPFYSSLLRDTDGQYFMNYLASGIDSIDSFEDADQFSNLLKRHKEIVEFKLQKFHGNEKLYPKYEWVAQYHNYFCSVYITHNSIENLELVIEGIPPRNFTTL